MNTLNFLLSLSLPHNFTNILTHLVRYTCSMVFCLIKYFLKSITTYMYNIYVFIYEINLENNTMQNKLFICTQVQKKEQIGTKIQEEEKDANASEICANNGRQNKIKSAWKPPREIQKQNYIFSLKLSHIWLSVEL